MIAPGVAEDRCGMDDARNLHRRAAVVFYLRLQGLGRKPAASDDHHPNSGEQRIEGRCGGIRYGNGEPESGARTVGVFDADPAAHRAYQAPADGKSEPGSTVTAGDG